MQFAHVLYAAQVNSAVFLEKVMKAMWLSPQMCYYNKSDHHVAVTAHSTVIYQTLVGISAYINVLLIIC
jgi:hypothetical protein